MARYSICLMFLLTPSLVLTGVPASEAGWYGCNGYYYTTYDYCPTCPTVTYSAPVATPAAPAPTAPAPTAGQSAAAPAGPMVYSAMKPMIGQSAGATISVPQSMPVQTYAPAPACYRSGGYSYPSTTPRSSWDFGRFPPYR